jgi:hypothetical protein
MHKIILRQEDDINSISGLSNGNRRKHISKWKLSLETSCIQKLREEDFHEFSLDFTSEKSLSLFQQSKGRFYLDFYDY